jgi:hypothetical protein
MALFKAIFQANNHKITTAGEGMNARGESQERVILFLAFSVPFLILYISDFFIGRRDYDMFAAETLGILFSTGMGLIHSNFASLERFIAHHPGIPLTELSAIFYLFAEIPKNDFTAFRVFCIIINFAVVIITSVWGSLLACKLKVSWIPIFIASSLAAIMPGVAALSPTLCAYHTYGVLLLPVSLGILAIAERESIGDPVVGATYFVIGYLLSIMHLGIIVIVSFVLASSVIYRRASSSWNYDSSNISQISNIYKILIVVALFFFVYTLLSVACFAVVHVLSYKIWGSNFLRVKLGGMFGLYILTFVPAAFVTYLLFRISLFNKLLFDSVGKILVGWLAGINIFIFVWPISSIKSLSSKGGAAKTDFSIYDLWLHQDIAGFIQAAAWHMIIPVLLIVGLLAFIRSINGKSQNRDRDRFVGVFIISVISLNLIAAADISLIQNVERTYNASRYFLTVIVAVPIALLWIYRVNRLWGHFGILLASVIFVLSTVDYINVVVPVSSQNYILNEKGSQLIEKHLSENKDGVILTYNNYIPDACNVANAFWLLSSRDQAIGSMLAENRRILVAWPTIEASLTEKPTLIFSSRPVQSIPGRVTEELLTWTRPQGKTAMPSYLQIVYVEGSKAD